MKFVPPAPPPPVHSSTRSSPGRRCASCLAVATLALATASCGTGEPTRAETSTPAISPASTSPPTSTTPTSTIQAPTTPAPTTPASFTAAVQVQWTLDLLANPTMATDELEMRFAPSFLSVVPPATLTATLVELTGTYEVVEADGSDVERTGIIERQADGLRLTFLLEIDPTDGGRLVALGFQPAGEQIDGELTSDIVDQAFASIAPEASYGIFEVADGRCEAVHRAGTDEPLAIASQFKLWVLIAVAEYVETGSGDWNDLITIDNVPPSLPDGPLTGLADGETRTVSELAMLMISISDNTATDLLIDHVGRGSVEAAMIASTADGASRNLPLLTTREAFLLKLDPTHADYVDLSPTQRSEYLDTVLSDPGLEVPQLSDPDVVDSLPPRPWQIDQIEWFATPLDMCQAMVRLAELASDPRHDEHLTTALGSNPGAELDTARWSTAWFKGGSEPGVFASTWYLVDANGSSFVVSGAANDAGEDFGDLAGSSATQLMIALLETRPS